VFLRGKAIHTVAAIAVLAGASAQTANNQADEPIIRINVNLVQVDAVVTDAKDKPVSNLTADDFEIRQDGKVQKITNFSYISLRTTAAPAAALPARKAATPKGTPPPPPAVIKASDVRRTVALVVDDLGLAFDSISRVRQSLKKFVDTEMQPGDLVAIVRTGAGMGALQQFTADKRILYAAIERVKFNSIGRVGVSSFTPLGEEPAAGTAAATEDRNEIFSVGTLGAVRFIVDGLRELPGRKSVVLFSENMQLFGREGENQRTMDAMRVLCDEANRSSVVIYTIDPRGLQYYGLTAADNTSRVSPQELNNLPMQRARQVFRSQDGLVLLANETGGLFLHDTNDIDGALRKVVEDTEGYYLIGYHPEASTFDARTGQPKYHKVTVHVKGAGLHVRSRTGFYGRPDRERQQMAHTRAAEIGHALASPFGAADIHVRLTPLFTDSPKAGPILNTMLYIDTRDLKFVDEPDGRHKAVIDLVAMTFGDSGQAVDTTDRTYTIRANDEVYKTALKVGLLYAVSHPVKKPGAYQMRVVVRDANSEQLGSASQFIEVPDVAKGKLTLSSLILKEAAPNEAGPTTSATPAEGQVAEQNPMGSSAVRVFKPGATMIYGYQVLNAQPGSDKKPSVEAHTKLFRDGKEVYSGKPMELKFTDQPDPAHLVAGGTMKLGDQITPGDYVLQIIVTDRLASEKSRVASQWMDFEIQK